MNLLADPSGINLAKLAIRHSDGIIFASDKVNPEIASAGREAGLPGLEYDKDSIADGSYIDAYDKFYDQTL